MIEDISKYNVPKKRGRPRKTLVMMAPQSQVADESNSEALKRHIEVLEEKLRSTNEQLEDYHKKDEEALQQKLQSTHLLTREEIERIQNERDSLIQSLTHDTITLSEIQGKRGVGRVVQKTTHKKAKPV